MTLYWEVLILHLIGVVSPTAICLLSVCSTHRPIKADVSTGVRHRLIVVRRRALFHRVFSTRQMWEALTRSKGLISASPCLRPLCLSKSHFNHKHNLNLH